MWKEKHEPDDNWSHNMQNLNDNSGNNLDKKPNNNNQFRHSDPIGYIPLMAMRLFMLSTADSIYMLLSTADSIYVAIYCW